MGNAGHFSLYSLTIIITYNNPLESLNQRLNKKFVWKFLPPHFLQCPPLPPPAVPYFLRFSGFNKLISSFKYFITLFYVYFACLSVCCLFVTVKRQNGLTSVWPQILPVKVYVWLELKTICLNLFYLYTKKNRLKSNN